MAEAGEQVAGHDPVEADRLAWVAPEEVRALVRAGAVPEGLSLVTLLWLLGGLVDAG